jgi:7-carboxy-7-deazaguanine synthase (Cx14CxxC type)
MTYTVKEVFYTLQGEGANAGRAAVFCRFVGCNLWSGREQHRASAICQFCDTDFLGTDGLNGGKHNNALSLAELIEASWGGDPLNKLVVFTGGEPLLQLNNELIQAVRGNGFEIAVETNGTIPVPVGIDWVCVSPKANANLVVKHGDELKLVYPQENLDPATLTNLGFKHFFLQPMDGPEAAENTTLTVQYCLDHPHWCLTLQSHKIIGLP